MNHNAKQSDNIEFIQGIWQSAMVRFCTIGKNPHYFTLSVFFHTFPHYLWKTTDISIELQSKCI